MKMKINIENCVRHLGARDGGGKGRRYMVETMIGHLKQVRDGLMTGDYGMLDEFFGIYLFSDDVQYARVAEKVKEQARCPGCHHFDDGECDGDRGAECAAEAERDAAEERKEGER